LTESIFSLTFKGIDEMRNGSNLRKVILGFNVEGGGLKMNRFLSFVAVLKVIRDRPRTSQSPDALRGILPNRNYVTEFIDEIQILLYDYPYIFAEMANKCIGWLQE
jgi:hypothetical protein